MRNVNMIIIKGRGNLRKPKTGKEDLYRVLSKEVLSDQKHWDIQLLEENKRYILSEKASCSK